MYKATTASVVAIAWSERHGFYIEAHQQETYTRLLVFLPQHLGGKTASSRSGAASVSK